MNTNIGVFEDRDVVREQQFGAIWRDLIPKVFADVPKYYDKGNAIASLGLMSLWSDRFVKNIKLPEGAIVLDVCTGTHEVARRLLKYNPNATVLAIDRSAEMIEEGQRVIAKTGLTIDATVGDVHTLPYDDASFDAVTLQFSTRHLRVVEVFREIYRVLKPGGVFYHSDMLRPSSIIIEKPYMWYLPLFLNLTATLMRSTEESRQCVTYFSESIKGYLTPAEMTELLRAIGFENIEEYSFMTGVFSRHSAQKPMTAK
ncbi:MAG: hypothetical protein UY04_C0015G0019 [Parcubacteria group bacterium GW2011_GWA2_47_7]|nr:MAG: hypothetical protein UY04_C0015G0019 [Parcubacteria group bacterium GW2011_GWA2_47_7]